MYYLWHCGPGDLNIWKHTCTGARCEFCIIGEAKILDAGSFWRQWYIEFSSVASGTLCGEELTNSQIEDPYFPLSTQQTTYFLDADHACNSQLSIPNMKQCWHRLTTRKYMYLCHFHVWRVLLPCLASTTKCCSCMLFSEPLAWTVCIYNDIYEVTKLPIRDLQ